MMEIAYDGRAGEITLDDPQVFTAFLVTGSGPADTEALGQALGELGWIADEQHAFIHQSAVSALAGDAAVTDAWRTAFGRMVRYADSKGWLDPETGAIRAHIQWRPAN